MMNVTEYYEHELKTRGYQSDAAQRAAVERLQRCYGEWVAYKARRSNAFKKLVVRPICRAASTCGAASGAARAS